MSHATLSKPLANASVLAEEINLINSLGGPALSPHYTLDGLSIALENQAAAQVPAWILGVAAQALRQQAQNLAVTSRKQNRYMSF